MIRLSGILQYWDTVLLTLGLAYLLHIAFRIARWYFQRQRYIQTIRTIPTPPMHWFWGHLKSLDPKKNQNEIRNWMKTVSSKAVQTWFFSFGLGINVRCHHTDTLQPLLNTAEPKSDAYRFSRPWIGNGLIVSDGKRWARDRRLLTPAFHFDILKHYVTIFNGSVDILLEKWDRLISKDNEPLEVVGHVSEMTLDSLIKCTFGIENQSNPQSSQRYLECVNRNAESIIKRVLQPFLWPDFIYNMTKAGKQWRIDCDFVHEYASKIIRKRRQALKEEQQKEKICPDLAKQRSDFLTILLNARDDEGNGLSDVEIREQVDTFMFAGHDTTASAISFCLYNLACYPEHQNKCRQEVIEVLQGRQELDWNDISSLPYLTMCIKESMRIDSPVPEVGRLLENPLAMDGINLQPGAWLTIDMFGIHHNPAVWNDPEKYDPLRFSPENSEHRHSHAFIPFSAGPRNCIGQHFAMNELKVAIARILQRFYLQPVENKPCIRVPLIVQRATDGVWINFTAIKDKTTRT